MILVSFSALFSVSCINNDIPFPVILGEVKSITFEGQKGTPKIDFLKRTITLELNDTVDVRAIEVLDMQITPDSRPSIKVGEKIDFSQDSSAYGVHKDPYKFTVSTYQDYEWQILCTQTIDRHLTVEGGLGPANIDPTSHIATIKVSQNASLAGLIVESFQLAPALAKYTPDLTEITDFTKPITFEVSYFDITETWTVAAQKSTENVTTDKVEKWATFAYVKGFAISTSPLRASFEYRKKNETEWKNQNATRKGGEISTRLENLSSNTEYLVRARLGEEVAPELSFRTEAMLQIENMSFEDWAQSGMTWYANTSPSNTYWASGNAGVNMTPVSKESNTRPTTDAKVGAKAAEIKTIGNVPLVGLAAGSLFTGDFIPDILKPLDSPKFSRLYTGRPTQLSFWYKYDPKIIDFIKSGYEDQRGKVDRFIVYILLGDWEADHLLSSELKGEATTGAIAYGEFVSDKAVSAYTQQTIQIKYLNNRPVKKIILVATSSINGDKYVGASNSLLLIDGLEFGWAPPATPPAL